MHTHEEAKGNVRKCLSVWGPSERWYA